MSGSSKFDDVKKAYQDVWRVCPYTSFVMFDYLLKNVKVGGTPLRTWDKFLGQKKNTLKKAGLIKENVALPTDENLWKGQSGLCTSFAIRVVHQPKIVTDNFQYGDLGNHRASWEISGKEAFLVDSSARQAIEFKDISAADPVKHKISNKELSWRWDSSKNLIFESKPPGGHKAFEQLGKKEWKKALQRCLIQLLGNDTMLILFRCEYTSSEDKIVLAFIGMVVWDFGKKTLKWSGTDGAHTATFGAAGGSDADDTTARTVFLDWINSSTWRKAQYTAELKGIHEALWNAAKAEWGKPKYQYAEQVR